MPHRISRLTATLALVLPLVGCLEKAPALHPLFPKSATLRGLAGCWGETGDADVVCFAEEADGSGYRVAIEDGGRSALTFAARLGTLAGATFLDLEGVPEDARARAGMWPIHVFARVELSEGRLEIAMLDQKWLASALRDGQVYLAHEVVGEDVVVTAPTEALQRFLVEWSSYEPVFEEPTVLIRRAASAARSGSSR